MKIMLIYKNGRRVAGDSRAFISPYFGEVDHEEDLEHLTEGDFQKVLDNPARYDIANKKVK